MLIVTSLNRTCIACPAQWEGRLANRQYIYIRFRHGHLSAGVGKNINDAVSHSSRPGLLLLSHYVDEADGYLTDYEMQAIMEKECSVKFANSAIAHPCTCDPDELLIASCPTCGTLASPSQREKQRQIFKEQIESLKKLAERNRKP